MRREHGSQAPVICFPDGADGHQRGRVDEMWGVPREGSTWGPTAHSPTTLDGTESTAQTSLGWDGNVSRSGSWDRRYPGGTALRAVAGLLPVLFPSLRD